MYVRLLSRARQQTTPENELFTGGLFTGAYSYVLLNHDRLPRPVTLFLDSLRSAGTPEDFITFSLIAGVLIGGAATIDGGIRFVRERLPMAKYYVLGVKDDFAAKLPLRKRRNQRGK